MGAGCLDAAHEKYLGDLVTKFVEHFLPMFVGTYSAAPYRLAFGDFHPEKALSFLPFELDYTHLRMIWRRWRKKAHLKVRPWGFGSPPSAPPGWMNPWPRSSASGATACPTLGSWTTWCA